MFRTMTKRNTLYHVYRADINYSRGIVQAVVGIARRGNPIPILEYLQYIISRFNLILQHSLVLRAAEHHVSGPKYRIIHAKIQNGFAFLDEIYQIMAPIPIAPHMT